MCTGDTSCQGQEVQLRRLAEQTSTPMSGGLCLAALCRPGASTLTRQANT